MNSMDMMQGRGKLIDAFDREVSYLRVSVTDRCDFRCFYCMSEHMHFLPKKEVLTLEELDRVCSVFIENGVRNLRLTGGEPLVRRNVKGLIRSLSRHLDSGALDELTLTTNGSQLEKMAADLFGMGVRRINLSLDSLKPDRFADITRRGRLDQVLRGIDAALAVGMKLKLNAVALKGVNDDEYDDLIRFCHERGMDLTLIEMMPMGDVSHDRGDMYVPLSGVKAQLEQSWTLSPSRHKSCGPANYFTVEETGGRVGFIAPMSHNFCESCNRVRISSTGILYLCLGKEDAVDLRSILRASDSNQTLEQAIRQAIYNKPRGHDFMIERGSADASVSRHMSVTGG